MELQNVRHDELLLELAALRRNQQHPSNSSSHGSSQSLGAGFDLDSRGSSPGQPSLFLGLGLGLCLGLGLFFSFSFDNSLSIEIESLVNLDSLRYLANGSGSATRTTPLGQSASNLDALLEMDLAVSSKSFDLSYSMSIVETTLLFFSPHLLASY